MPLTFRMTSRISRRRFIERVSGGAVPLFAGVRLHASAGGVQPSGRAPGEISADLVIVGGGFGGCAAALAAARSGLRVVMTEETDWIGGQLSYFARKARDREDKVLITEAGSWTLFVASGFLGAG